MKKFITLVALIGLVGCGDAMGVAFEEAGEFLENTVSKAVEVPCIEDGSERWAEFPIRTGRTTVTVCYEPWAQIDTPVTSEVNCWNGLALWTASDPDTGFIFCPSNVVSVTVRF